MNFFNYPIISGIFLIMLMISNAIMDAISFTPMRYNAVADAAWHGLKWFFLVPGLVLYGALISKNLWIWLYDIWHPNPYMFWQGAAFVLGVAVWQIVYRALKKRWIEELPY